MKYYVFFHLVSGDSVRMTVLDDADVILKDDGTAFAQGLLSKPFGHFIEDGKLVIVNMNNVTYIKVAKAE